MEELLLTRRGGGLKGQAVKEKDDEVLYAWPAEFYRKGGLLSSVTRVFWPLARAKAAVGTRGRPPSHPLSHPPGCYIAHQKNPPRPILQYCSSPKGLLFFYFFRLTSPLYTCSLSWRPWYKRCTVCDLEATSHLHVTVFTYYRSNKKNTTSPPACTIVLTTCSLSQISHGLARMASCWDHAHK